jgi:hypothetical protein
MARWADADPLWSLTTGRFWEANHEPRPAPSPGLRSPRKGTDGLVQGLEAGLASRYHRKATPITGPPMLRLALWDEKRFEIFVCTGHVS